jgi:hypothetical protein
MVVLVAVLLVAFGAGIAQAQADYTVNASELVNGYMNVFDLGGVFLWGSGWGLPDLTAVFDGNVVTVGPNTIGDPDPYWYIGGGAPGNPGNKIMEANLYAQVDGPLAGQTVTFSGVVIDNTLTSAHVVKAFVKDYAPDFSSYVESSVVLSAEGAFTVSLATINDAARHVQWGLQMTGVNVWFTDVADFGAMVVGPDGSVGNEDQTWGGVKTLYR